MSAQTSTLELSDSNPVPSVKGSVAARRVRAVARVLLGLVFFASGVTGLLMAFGVMPPPPANMPAGAAALSAALMNSHYLFELIKLTELAVGALLISNRFVPLALVLLAPVLVNIVAFHLFLAPTGLPVPLVLLGVELFLAWSYRAHYRPLLVARATPGEVRS